MSSTSGSRIPPCHSRPGRDVTDPKKFKLDTINAKGETLLDSNTWRYAFLHHRCLVPVDSFIEWKRMDPKTKLPWMFAMKDDELFALAGVSAVGVHPITNQKWIPSRSSPPNRMT